MARRDYVFGYDAEPADERPTGYGETDFDRSSLVTMSTAPAPWAMSEHSTFEMPSRATDRVRALRRRQLKRQIVALALLAAAAAASAAMLILRPWST
jgi:hypothetical protein